MHQTIYFRNVVALNVLNAVALYPLYRVNSMQRCTFRFPNERTEIVGSSDNRFPISGEKHRRDVESGGKTHSSNYAWLRGRYRCNVAVATEFLSLAHRGCIIIPNGTWYVARNFLGALLRDSWRVCVFFVLFFASRSLHSVFIWNIISTGANIDAYRFNRSC